ncbi:transposase [Embleya sp. NPDC056575]|uniref:transposase n=1 Tax=unclassified Embleya TaxID=2699296 RepID=UPI00368758AF
MIVHVLTTPAPEQDVDAVERIHAGLAARRFLPAEHLVDSGYVTPATIHRAAIEHGVALVGPVRADPGAAAHPGFAKEDFAIDRERQTHTCPRGNVSPPWKPTRGGRQPRISVLSPRTTCRACEDRFKCTGNTGGRGRQILLMPRPLQEIQNRVRREQETDDWKRRTAMRVGCEATVSETVRAHGLRNCRYRGRAKTHVQHVLVAAGTNVARLSECIPPGTVPARTPKPFSRFRRSSSPLTWRRSAVSCPMTRGPDRRRTRS